MTADDPKRTSLPEPEDEFVGSVPIWLEPGAEGWMYTGYSRTVFSAERIWTRLFSTDENIQETLKVTYAEFTRHAHGMHNHRMIYIVRAELRSP